MCHRRTLHGPHVSERDVLLRPHSGVLARLLNANRQRRTPKNRSCAPFAVHVLVLVLVHDHALPDVIESCTSTCTAIAVNVYEFNQLNVRSMPGLFILFKPFGALACHANPAWNCSTKPVPTSRPQAAIPFSYTVSAA